ncbi:exo-beta-N-acetylmuramidase NamZ domain-containing protein [Candidatus Protochlamydia amoebophila]|uniref:exo-beta-N-acetylmuramidase NamZ family protein n=1 Tax=Candidatus Protochlamydia amoebophila TaxID=362787 RepID=UPI001ED9B04F|nr:DUF1343 domain-containing protein [Candidatus Protochlamydia amoebophila]
MSFLINRLFTYANPTNFISFFIFIVIPTVGFTQVTVGIDSLFDSSYVELIKGKRIGLVTNHTAINHEGETTINCLKKNASFFEFKLQALFAPEHGLQGIQYADEIVKDTCETEIPIYSLHGSTRRPTQESLKNLDVLIYDIQDIGSRSYTYISTLFYVMEEAAKLTIPVIVLDRPNPINGLTIDGPLLEEKWRSFVGYVNIPYCHGLTIGELASYFNGEYKINCLLKVIPMKGWKREMTFNETGLIWIPTSPHIPEAETSLYYPITGLLGELQLVNIGVGYTLPFKVVGAPWINAEKFAKKLNEQKFPGVRFHPFYYRPFFGRFAHQNCQGVLIILTNPKKYLPVSTQYLLIGMLKSLYPKEFQAALNQSSHRQDMFNKVNGTAEVFRIIKEEQYILWKLRSLHEKERALFVNKRASYLLY